jgi:hypothetical protein
MPSDPNNQPFIGTIETSGRRYQVTCRVGFDGVEYVGRLWFAEEEWEDAGLPDRGAIPGKSREDVLSQARDFSQEDLVLRYRRALSDKRRYLKLRRDTDEILTKIRYLNQIATSVRNGLLDEEGANQEIDLTEHQLHECIQRLRDDAGLEG